MTEQVADAASATTEAERKRAPAANFLPIVRGRLPLLFVHAIRFDAVLNAMANKDLASKLATSVGKVFDIKKGRNFAYVDAGFKPSQDDIAAAEAWVAAVGSENAKGQKALGDAELMGRVVEDYKARGLASAEEAAALSAARGAARKKAEGGSTAAPASETTQAGTEAAADALLS